MVNYKNFVGVLRIWNSENGKEVYRQDKSCGDEGKICNIHYLSSLKSVAVITHDHNIIIHSLQQPKVPIIKQVNTTLKLFQYPKIFRHCIGN